MGAFFHPLTPANAGAQMEFSRVDRESAIWVPAFAGMSGEGISPSSAGVSLNEAAMNIHVTPDSAQAASDRVASDSALSL